MFLAGVYFREMLFSRITGRPAKFAKVSRHTLVDSQTFNNIVFFDTLRGVMLQMVYVCCD